MLLIMRLSFKQILVPYDGSKIGENAFHAALYIAKKFDSKIFVLSCIERESTFGFFETKSDKKSIKDRKERIQQKISKLEEIANNNNVNFGFQISKCSVASKFIVSFVKSENIDLIVMAKSGRINPEKIYHESTVNYVYGHVNCPMLNV